MSIADVSHVNKPIKGNGFQDKGLLGNRVEYMGETMKEFNKYRVKSGLTLVGGVATTAAATAVVSKSTTAQNAIKKLGKNIMNNESISKFVESAKPQVQKAANYVKNLSGPAKAILAAGTALTSVVLGVQASKADHKMGQIDQKYTDKAKIQKNLLG